MKISLTMKNNLIHIFVVVILVTIVAIISITNARYETIADLSGEANFPYTVLEINPASSNIYQLTQGNEIKLQYDITNSNGNIINTNNLQYYLKVTDENGLEVEGINVLIRESLDDGATFDSATAMNYISEKGFGPTILKCDGTAETKTFDIFLKSNDSIQNGILNLKLRVYAESITNLDFYIIKTLDINLNVTNQNGNNSSNSLNGQNQLDTQDINNDLNNNSENNSNDEVNQSETQGQEEQGQTDNTTNTEANQAENNSNTSGE